MKRLRVLMLGWEFPPRIHGGLGVACHGLARALAKSVDLRVLVPRADLRTFSDGFSLMGLDSVRPEDLQAAEGKYSEDDFATVERIPVPLDPYADENFQTDFSPDPRQQLALFREDDLYGSDLGERVIAYSKIAAKLAMRQSLDLVHAHDWMTFLAGVEVKKATGKPLVVHVHSTQFDRSAGETGGWIFEVEKFGMEQADRVMAVSGYTGSILAGRYGIHPAKIRVVHNGVEPVAAFRTAKDSSEKLVLFLGRLTAQKGPDTFVEIAARVAEARPDVRFVMAGAGDRFRPLEDAVAARGLGDRFRLTGFLEKGKVNELLSMTDVYCMPSVSEPFGLSALEAAQFGVPAVISKQSGVAEVLKSALTADSWDVAAMARHIVDLLDEPALHADVAKRAREEAASCTWDKAAARVVGIYRELV